jgi:hypothetical protein
VWVHSVSSSIETSDVEMFEHIVPFLSNPLLHVIYINVTKSA